MKFYLIIMWLLLSPVIADAQSISTWTPQWKFDPMDDSISCSVFSNEISFTSRYLTNHAYIGIQEDNTITIHTRQNTFDSKYISMFGIRADKNEAILHPTYLTTHMVKFSPEKSKLILEQLFNAKTITLQVSFFPEARVVNNELAIAQDYTALKTAIASKNNCAAIKNSKGWVGVGLQDMLPKDSYMKFIKDNTDYSTPGVMIWSVHPKKVGSKSGLLNFDIILAVDEKPVELKNLLNLLSAIKPGDSVDLEILRGNNIKNVSLTKPKL